MRSHISRGLKPLLVAALAVTAIGFGAASGSASTSVYSWPGAVMLHVHTTPADSSPGYVQSDPYYVDCPNACDRPYDVGQSITLWAHPTNGFAFTGWTAGPCAGTSTNPCTFTISADTDVTADFSGKYVPDAPADPGTRHLQVIMDPFFCGICSPPHTATRSLVRGADATHGLRVSSCAPTRVAKSASAGAKTSCGPSYAVVFSNDNKIACFDNGWNACSANYPVGAKVSLEAEACGYFLGWEDSANDANPRVVTMDTDKTVIAAFLIFC